LFKRGETWLHDRLTINEVGTSDAHIIFGAYDTGAKPIIDADEYYSYSVDFVAASYVDFADINVTGSKVTGAGIRISSGSHLTIERVLSSGNLGRGIQLYGAGINDVIIVDCEQTDNGKSGTVIESTGTINNITFRRCRSDNNGSDGFSVSANAGTATNILYEYCTAINHLETDDGAGDGFTAHGSGELIMRYCWSENNAKSAVCFVGTTISTIHSCVLLAKSDAMIGGVQADGTAIIYNNTIYCSAQHGDGLRCTSGSITSRNNIIVGFSNGVNPTGDATIDTDYDNVYNASTPYLYATEGNNSIQSDPLFVTAGSDFILQSNSPCINAGINIGLTKDYAETPIVGKPDMGAYEKLPTINYRIRITLNGNAYYKGSF